MRQPGVPVAQPMSHLVPKPAWKGVGVKPCLSEGNRGTRSSDSRNAERALGWKARRARGAWVLGWASFVTLASIFFFHTPPARSVEPARTESIKALVDRYVESRLKTSGLEPAPRANDAEYLRRVSLDLIGRIPTVAEVRAFLDDQTGRKRARLVDRLLASPEHARHFATVWRMAWIPQADTATYAELVDGLEAWLREGLIRNTPYDRLVSDQLTTSLLPPRPGQPQPPRAFLEAAQFKPENLAANTTRVFLGLNLDCAQCHDHPFARWTRDDFWQTAAFFAPSPLKMPIEGTTRTVSAKLPTGESVDWSGPPDETSGRALLASWVTSRDNPYFARNAVNRVWAQFFATGLVEPLDDLSPDNPGYHAELLDALARAFADERFDLKTLIRALVLTQAYQRTSAVDAQELNVGMGTADPFVRMPVRALSGEQLYDSLITASGRSLSEVATGVRSERARFASRYRAARPALAERSVPQTLVLYNGNLVAELTHPGRSPLLRTLVESPFFDDAGRIEVLFLAAFGRMPSADERKTLASYLAEKAPGKGRTQPLSDLFWALINASEFNSNH